MSDTATPLSPARRRRALAWGHANGGLWAAGNSLSTGSLVIYLASDLGAQGLGLSLVLAAPNLAGLLRLVAPAIIYRAATARRACLILSSASYLLIVGLPLVAALAPAISRQAAVAAMIGLLFAHQLLEYLGTVALWSWWGDLVPARIRGRYFARRQMIQLAVSIPTLLAGGYFSDVWRGQFKSDPDRLLLAYAIPTGLGAAFLLGSLVPLLLMPATRRYPRPDGSLLWSAVSAPFVDRRFWRLLVFRSWFSLANGVTQVVQSAIFPKSVLGFGVGPMNALRVVTGVGQLAGSRPVGKWSDRFGNRPVLVAAQACVSLSLVFYILARPETRWLLVGAWVLFAAYVAHNICLPNLVLKLSPDFERPAYVAANEALASAFHAAATVGGGLLFDYLQATSADRSQEPYRSCLVILTLGLVLRSFGVLLAADIREPGAWSWREIWAARRASVAKRDNG
jgi:MFS family permease